MDIGANRKRSSGLKSSPHGTDEDAYPGMTNEYLPIFSVLEFEDEPIFGISLDGDFARASRPGKDSLAGPASKGVTPAPMYIPATART